MDKAIKTPIPSGGLGWSAIGEEEIGAVTALLRNPERLWRYREDSESGSFERELRETLGVRHALMVNSGTSALSCCLAGLGVGAGDEVIVQGYTYVATASSCMDVGAVPIVAEIDGSLGLDPADVERKVTPRTKAVIMAHMQGVPGRIEAVRETAKKHGLYMVEDCCQAIGARYLGEHVGVRSDAFAWSLNFYKNITCGEGGVFFTDRDDVFQGGFCQSDPASALWKDRPAS
ncbi:MAG: aminotransferase class V-fold PLP-dependent enzyme, partial [Oscillospiraceae bacterium]|nr:aminotransferase class V-fold PLP-dependent enzyme [Oscillospiraceae bacterium]